ncbi:MAG TPA: helix-turn-helix transcriptional regulator [Casimicrobiaceae bacterium]|nr:helix-turn-helix transcriptional regulator [Casimicrobiaceae bacterium]
MTEQVARSAVLSNAPATPSGDEPPTGPDAEFLGEVGRRVRTLREQRGMTRKALAKESDVSERYLGQLEAGEGNASILLLRRISSALNVSIAEFLVPEDRNAVERRLITRFLQRLPAHRMEDVIFRLMRDYGHEEALRKKRIALIGLRGAGKTTLGNLLAKALSVPCVEVNEAIRRQTGLPVSEVISLYGQGGYRRIERQALERVVGDYDRAVLVVGGGIVSEEGTFNLLLSNCYTVWLKASPEEHMARVLAQGDFRPMAGNEEAMDDLKRILAAREPLYRKADAVVDTAGEAPEASLRKLVGIVMA